MFVRRLHDHFYLSQLGIDEASCCSGKAVVRLSELGFVVPSLAVALNLFSYLQDMVLKSLLALRSVDLMGIVLLA